MMDDEDETWTVKYPQTRPQHSIDFTLATDNARYDIKQELNYVPCKQNKIVFSLSKLTAYCSTTVKDKNTHSEKVGQFLDRLVKNSFCLILGS